MNVQQQEDNVLKLRVAGDRHYGNVRWIELVGGTNGRSLWYAVVIVLAPPRALPSLCAWLAHPQVILNPFMLFLISQPQIFCYSTVTCSKCFRNARPQCFVRSASVGVGTACHEEISLPIVSRATDSSSSTLDSDIVEVLILGVPMWDGTLLNRGRTRGEENDNLLTRRLTELTCTNLLFSCMFALEPCWPGNLSYLSRRGSLVHLLFAISSWHGRGQ